MIFVNHARYIADQDKIAASRPHHRDYLAGLKAEGKVVAAGPYTDGSGTLIIYDVESAEQVNALIAADPFTTAGIFVSTEVHPWKIVFSAPEQLAPTA